MNDYFIIDQYNESKLSDETLAQLTKVKYYNIIYLDNQQLRKLTKVKNLDLAAVSDQVSNSDLLFLTELEYLNISGSKYLTEESFRHMKKLKMVVYGHLQILKNA